MANRTKMIVVDKNGLQGTIAHEETVSTSSGSGVLVHFENGQQVFVPSELLSRRADGHYYLALSIEELLARQEKLDNTTEELVIPVTEERISVQTRAFESGRVEIHKRVRERTEVVDQPGHSEEVEIERVAINRYVDEAAPVRHEGDTLIIPLLEEVLVVEKRLLLREEVHIKKLRKEVYNPQEVLLRAEDVEIVRKPNTSAGYEQTETQDR